jgi:hypothetical protein
MPVPEQHDPRFCVLCLSKDEAHAAVLRCAAEHPAGCRCAVPAATQFVHLYEATHPPADDNGSHCCGAPVDFDPDRSTERTRRYHCRQCGLLQDRR